MHYPVKFLPDHYRADVRGMVPQHVLIMERRVGRAIVKGEIIHHIDWHKWNNPEDGSNYLMMTRLNHQRLPALQARFILEKGLKQEWLAYWERHKDEIDELDKLNKQLVKHLNELEILKSKEWRRERKRRRKGLSGSDCSEVNTIEGVTGT